MIVESKIQRGVAALILNPDDKTKGLKLFHKWRNAVSIPSGTIDGDDVPDDTLKREMKEELGIDIVSYALLEVIRHSGQGREYKTWIYVVDSYLGDIENLEPYAHSDLGWVDHTQVPFKDPTNEVDSIMSDYLTKQKLSVSLEGYEPELVESSWYKIPGHNYHLAKRDGTVKNVSTGYETKGNLDDKGYLRTSIWDNDIKKKTDVKIHTLICTAFHGEGKPNEEVDHINGKRDDNRASNLKWVTRAENMAKVHSLESNTYRW